MQQTPFAAQLKATLMGAFNVEAAAQPEHCKLHSSWQLQTMLKRQYIVSVGWERRLFYYEDTKADKRTVTACRIVPDARLEQQGGAAHQGHTSDVLTADKKDTIVMDPLQLRRPYL